MHISFDLDGTLIPLQHTFETEKRNIPARLLGVEPLRLSTVDLFGRRQEQRHTLHIYTSS